MTYNLGWVQNQLNQARARANHRRLERTIARMPEWQRKDIGWPTDHQAGSDGPVSREAWPGDFRHH